MNIFGIGLPEMGLILLIALLVFGPKKLPEIGPASFRTEKITRNRSQFRQNDSRISRSIQGI